MSGHHHHGHHHHHHGDRKGNILFAAILNFSFVIIEVIGGLLTNSVAILSDALHDLGDSIALFSAYIAEKQAERSPDKKRTFGYARISVFSALFSAVILIVGSIFILTEAIQRLFSPEPVHATGMILLAVFGVGVNLVAFFRLSKGMSANEKVLSWHLLEDVIGWAAVLVGATIIYFTDFYIIDPILTVGYTLFILWGVWGGLKNVMNILMQGTPAEVDIEKIKQEILSIVEVQAVHDIHVWSLDGEHNVLTCHVVLDNCTVAETKKVKESIEEHMKSFNISHTTIECEIEGECVGENCID
jgi:cobalt-zinc-cadmium efflux system protein